jgi:hypothetical protein
MQRDKAAVSKTCLVRFDNNKYSFASRVVGRPVEIHAGASGRAKREPVGRSYCDPPAPARCLKRQLALPVSTISQ